MKLHLVGGFLGSGKTTAIINAAKKLMKDGKRVGVITNDQGRYLVDTAFFKAAALPTVEITGGCFCCNYRDLQTQVSELVSAYDPDVIFAESVGSCADMVATVIKPLQQLEKSMHPSSFSVFTDIRMFRRWILDEPLPFSDDVLYIYEKQLEEASLLVLNKIDLLPEKKVTSARVMAAARFGDKYILAQQANDETKIAGWVNLIEGNMYQVPRPSLHIDYQRYGLGESKLVWMDQRIKFIGETGSAGDVSACFIESVMKALLNGSFSPAHVKFFVETGQANAKISFSGLDSIEDGQVRSQLTSIDGMSVDIAINARLEGSMDNLRQLVQGAASQCSTAHNWSFESNEPEIFHPGKPKPQYRID